MPAPPPPQPSFQSRRSCEEQLGMGEAFQSATIVSFPVLVAVNVSRQSRGQKKKKILNGQFPQGKGGWGG